MCFQRDVFCLNNKLNIKKKLRASLFVEDEFPWLYFLLGEFKRDDPRFLRPTLKIIYMSLQKYCLKNQSEQKRLMNVKQ